MPAPGIKQRSFLDQKRCWKEWAELDSLNKVSLKFETEGVINEKTGRRFTWAAIEKAAFKWILDNQTEAREDLRLWWMSTGKILDDVEWKKFLAGIIRTLYYNSRNERRYRKEIEKNGLQEYAL